MRRAYQTDLSDAEWSYIEPLLPIPKAPGRPRLHTLREILDAIFYIARSGCAWRLLPHDFPPWKTVHHYLRLWRIDGTWERIHAALRKRVRVRKKRDPEPSAGVVDSQSVKGTGVGGDQRGYDGAKKVKGRKRHLLVDTEGMVLKARVHSAKVMDFERGSRSSSKEPMKRSRASLICGWTRATAEKTKGQTGCRRPWAGAWISSSVPESPPRKRC